MVGRIAVALLLCASTAVAQDAPKQAVLDTTAGPVVMDLLADRAPNHVALFIKTAQSGGYDGTTFFRMIKYGIVQGGDDPQLRGQSARALVDIGFDGYAIGGLAVGEPREVMLRTVAEVAPALPARFPGGVWRPAMKDRKGRERYEGYCTPVTYDPTPQQVAASRRDYLAWWAALHEVRERLLAAPVLRDHELTSAMPPARPWEEKCNQSEKVD